MPFQSQKKPLELSEAHKKQLQRAARSRTESLQRVERARILLAYARGETVSAIARMLGTNRQKVNRCIDKALQLGAEAALSDLPGRGRKRLIGRPARAWLVSLACRKAKELGYAQELWTTHLLAQHVRRHCRRACSCTRASEFGENRPRHSLEDTLGKGAQTPQGALLRGKTGSGL